MIIRCHETDAPTSAADRELYSTHTPAWMEGKPGESRAVSPATDSAILALIVAVLVLIGLNMRPVSRLLRSLPHNLISTRRRANAFDEHTANETRVAGLLLFEMCVVEGLLLFIWLGHPGTRLASATIFSTVAALCLLAAGYYAFQLAACCVVGYVFTDKTGASLWRRGLNASQIMLGLTLAVPALVSLFYPSLTSKMLILAAALYILSRIFYISKGFKIFYHNFPSLLYFILYLCTLEIIPVIAVSQIAADICVKVQ